MDKNHNKISSFQIARMLDSEKEGLFQYAGYRIAEIEDVRDILQELFLRLDSKCHLLNDVNNLKAYAYRTLANLCSEKMRRQKWKQGIRRIDDFPAFDIEEMTPANFDEEFRLINKLLSALPPEQSETIRLRIHSGLTFEDVAEATGVNVSTAKARFRYGIDKLRSGLKKQNLL